MSAPADEAAKNTPLTLEEHWANFKTTYNRNYESPDEEAKRFEIFKDKFASIEEHNKKYEAGETTFTQGINQFADLTQEEFAATYLMKVSPDPEHPKKRGFVGGYSK